MALENLNHFLVVADDLEATRDFYVDVLGLADGHRPPFDFAGYWIYLGDRAVVHLAEHRDYLDKVDHVRDGSADTATGSIDHIAFEATGLQDMMPDETLVHETRSSRPPSQGAGCQPAPDIRPRPERRSHRIELPGGRRGGGRRRGPFQLASSAWQVQFGSGPGASWPVALGPGSTCGRPGPVATSRASSAKSFNFPARDTEGDRGRAPFETGVSSFETAISRRSAAHCSSMASSG